MRATLYLECFVASLPDYFEFGLYAGPAVLACYRFDHGDPVLVFSVLSKYAICPRFILILISFIGQGFYLNFLFGFRDFVICLDFEFQKWFISF